MTLPTFTSIAKQRLADAGKRDRTINIKVAVGTARMMVEAGDDAVAALKWAVRGAHHPACPIPRGQGITSVTHDDCKCHVGAARKALEAYGIKA